MSIAVRTSILPLSVVDSLRGELRGATGGATGDQALYEVRTLEQLASDSLARQRFLLMLFGIFAALAAGRLLMHTVDGMQSTEPSTLTITIPVLVLAATLASLDRPAAPAR